MKKLLITLLITLSLGYWGWGQGSESFTNLPTNSSSSYLSRSWTGDDGVTWTAEGARTDQTINGKAICWGNSGTRNLITPTYSNGMGTLSFLYVRAFTGTGARSLEVYVNSSLKATITVSPTSNTVETFNQDINLTGDIILEIRSTGAAQVKVDDVTWNSYSGGGSAATPTFNPGTGSYYSTQNVTISTSTEDATIYYTTDGTDPDDGDTEYTSPVAINATTTLKAIAYADGYDPSSIATAVYTFPTEVANIAALRAGTPGSTQYKLTGEAILTYKTTEYNVKYLQDATGAIMIYDASGVITTSFNLYDGITGIIGTLTLFNSMLEFIPVTDPGAATSSGNTVTPVAVTLGNLTTDYQAQLVKVLNTSITQTGNFAANTSYDLTDGSKGSGVLQTQYDDLNYIGNAIPELPQDLTGVVLQSSTTTQLVPRSSDDFATAEIPWAVTFYVDMTNEVGTFTNVDIAGDFNGWGGTLTNLTLVSDNIYSYTTTAIFDVDDVISFKFRKDGSWSTAEPDPNRSYTVVAGENVYYAVYGVQVPAEITWANLQWPDAGSINLGGDYNVYSRLYANGLTGTQGNIPNLDVWIGYNSTDTDPSTWTEWVPASFGSDYGNNEEWIANLGSAITTAGTYYYASRFKLGFDDYVYGGYSSGDGGFWDGVNYVSGFLTVNTGEPTNHAADFSATTNSYSAITVSWTDSDADGYLIKGSDVSYEAITSPVDGTPESDGGLVKNIASEVETWQFTGLSASTQYFFKIFPYNGSGGAINYKTDGTVPQDDATTDEMPVLIINEVDSDTPGTDAAEFVELYDGGVGNTDLSGLAAVFFNGSDNLSYAAYDLDGYSTDGNGYFVLGNSGVTGVDMVFTGNFLQNGADAVALFIGDGDDFPNGTAVSTSNLLDAIVYDTDNTDDAELLVLVNASQPQVNENARGNKDNQSCQRLPNGSGGQRNTYTYDVATPTPDAANMPITTTWTGTTSTAWGVSTNWSNGVPAATTDAAVVNVGKANYPVITTAAYTINLSIASGASLQIDPSGSLTVSGTLTNNAGNSGLVIKSDATGTGSIVEYSGVAATVERYFTDDRWHYISAPVDNPTAGVFMGMYLKYWDEPTSVWTYIIDPDTVLAADMTGYALWTYNVGTATFTGNLNTGSKSIAVTNTDGGPSANDGFNFAGNPYPSSIDWEVSDGSGWSRTDIDESIYIWNGNPGFGNYGTYNRNSHVGTNEVTNIIPPHQGFFIHCDSAAGSATLTVNNGARVHNTQELMKSGKNTDPILKMSVVGNNRSDEIILLMHSLSSVNFESQFDALKLRGDETSPQLYSISKDKRDLSINSFPQSEDYNVIQIGLEVGIPETYTLSLSEFSGFGTNGNLYLEDKKEGLFLKIENDDFTYSFTASPLDDPMRFLLHLNGEMGIDPNEQPLNNPQIYSFDNDIYIKNISNLKGSVTIYDLMGRVIDKVSLEGEDIRTMDMGDHMGYMLVTVKSDNGVFSEKVFIR